MKRSLRFKLHWAQSTNFALKRASNTMSVGVLELSEYILLFFWQKQTLNMYTLFVEAKKLNKITDRFIYRCCFKRVQLKL